jgi:hypothetical protein
VLANLQEIAVSIYLPLFQRIKKNYWFHFKVSTLKRFSHL